MNAVLHLSPLVIVAALLALLPYLTAAFFPQRVQGSARALPAWAQLLSPTLLCAPYLLVAYASGTFQWQWLAVYALLPVGIAAVLRFAYAFGVSERIAPALCVLLVLGLAVDLRWFESAWPPHLSVFNKVLLLDAGIYAFVALRPLEGAGFDLRLRFRDARVGLREFLFYLPIALVLGLGLGFLHLHTFGESASRVGMHFASAWLFTFFFIAVPEELFFRGWLQNLLERRMGRYAALLVTAILFGLAHFNKRAAHFNWRYVLMAAIAGVFYGRAWRQERRVGASSVTHATVDAVWSLWLR